MVSVFAIATGTVTVSVVFPAAPTTEFPASARAEAASAAVTSVNGTAVSEAIKLGKAPSSTIPDSTISVEPT